MSIQLGFLQMQLICFLAVVRPKIGVLQLHANAVSCDRQVVDDYVNDPLGHHGKISARSFCSTISVPKIKP